jgi:hypothetical protein
LRGDFWPDFGVFLAADEGVLFGDLCGVFLADKGVFFWIEDDFLAADEGVLFGDFLADGTFLGVFLVLDGVVGFLADGAFVGVFLAADEGVLFGSFLADGTFVGVLLADSVFLTDDGFVGVLSFSDSGAEGVLGFLAADGGVLFGDFLADNGLLDVFLALVDFAGVLLADSVLLTDGGFVGVFSFSDSGASFCILHLLQVLLTLHVVIP